MSAMDQAPSLRLLRFVAGAPTEYECGGGDGGTIRIVGIVTGFAVEGICDPREKFVIVIFAGSNTIEELPTTASSNPPKSSADAANTELPCMAAEALSSSIAEAEAVELPAINSAPAYFIVAAGPALELPIITVVAAMFSVPAEARAELPAASIAPAYRAAASNVDDEEPAIVEAAA